MTNNPTCEKHSEEIVSIRTEFHEYKTATNRRLDEIIEKIKPQFTYPQITGFLLVLLGFMGSVMLYGFDTKSDARNNTTRIISIESKEVNNMVQYQNIDLKLEKLLTAVAVLESKAK